MHLAKDCGRSRAPSMTSIAESDFDDEFEDENTDGFSIIEAALSFASSMLGAGIVSIPYSMTANGI
jgi:hypothetical protein